MATVMAVTAMRMMTAMATIGGCDDSNGDDDNGKNYGSDSNDDNDSDGNNLGVTMTAATAMMMTTVATEMIWG